MTPKECIEFFRAMAHDDRGTTEEERLWKLPFLLGVLNEARMEAARRARLLEENTSEVCKIAVKAGRDTYSIDPRIIYIRRVKHSLIDRPLSKSFYKDMDLLCPGWESYDADEPATWIPWGDYQIRLSPPPDLDATINLMVVREPLDPVTINSSEDDMEIPPRYHMRLVDWMCYRAYMQRDAEEKYRPQEAAERLASFVEMFGPAESAVQEKWNARMHGYDEFEGLR